jgi:hypothetical protein
MIIFAALWYVVFGVLAVYCPIEWLEEETNTVKLVIIGALWPFLLIVGGAVLIRRAAKRLYADARVLIPKRRAPVVIPTPQRVTVEMLAASHDAEYKPGQWIN